ncbi:MAG TPA: PEP-CTERM sorting domain-containing protein [Candidatus Brocadiia bacterium]|nr:PEP-CTERM sorting domain-containing protein [Candidatus Brocadiia bacterium]
MKRLAMVLSVLLLALSGVAQGFQVSCAEGLFGLDYAYIVQVDPPDLGMWDFDVGICDLNPGNYTNISALDAGGVPIPGWGGSFMGIAEPAYPVDHSSATPHGAISPGPDHMTPAIMYWVGPGPLVPGAYIFGFDNPNLPQDVGWTSVIISGVASENWALPVGQGAGPVHAPVPEPGSIALLGLGLAGVTVLRRRMKK